MVVRMAMTAMWLNVDGGDVGESLRQAAQRVDGNAAEVIVDFSSVRRIDRDGLRAMEKIAEAGDEKGVRVLLCGVNVELYRVLKLTKLASRFSFARRDPEAAGEELGHHGEPATE